jgi:hypothetical protein
MSLIETVIEGTLKPGGTLEFDAKPNLPAGRVKLVLRQETEVARPAETPFWLRMQAMWAIPVRDGEPSEGGESTLKGVRPLGTEWDEHQFKKLSSLELQVMVTADMEDGDSNLRMCQICSEPPTALTKLLHGMLSRGLLAQDGRGRGTTYRLPGDSSHKLEKIPAEQLTKLRAIAAPAFMGERLPILETRRTILQICQGRYFTAAELAELMNRNPKGLRNRFLTPLVEEGLLMHKYPAEPNRPGQAYTTKEPA